MYSLFDQKLCSALVEAKTHTTEICCQLHSAFHNGLPEDRVREQLTDARKRTEKLLVAILAAEQSIAPVVKSDNVIAIGDASYQRDLETVAEIVGAPQFDGAAS